MIIEEHGNCCKPINRLNTAEREREREYDNIDRPRIEDFVKGGGYTSANI